MQATARDAAKLDKKDTKESSDKPADDKSVAKQDDKPVAKQNDNPAAAQTAPQPKSAASAKDEKSDKASDKTKNDDTKQDDTGTSDDKQLASVEQPVSGQQILPAVPVVPEPVAADTDTDAQEDIAIDGTAPLTKGAAPSSDMDVPQSDSLDAPAEPGQTAQTQTVPQTQSQQEQPESGEPEAGVAVAAVAVQAAPPPVTTKDANKPWAVRPAAKSEAASTVKPEDATAEQATDELTQSVKASGEPVPEAKPAKTEPAKAEGIDGATPKDQVAHLADNAKPAAPDSPKVDAPQADVRPVEADPAAAKPVPHSASVSNAAFAINTIAAPQAAQHSQAPLATQHVQVTAQPAPNVPALAVEISAKSQSGAKQFDIRLDPPELGRVEVRLSIDATGKASAHLSADQPQTLSLLQKDAPLLTRALREAGLDVSQDGLNFSLRQQAHDQSGNDGNHGRFGSSRAFSLAATTTIDPTAAVIAYRGVTDGRVDIRV